MNKTTSGIPGKIWDFFCSLKLTITLLIILAVTSIIGTVIQQNLTMAEYLERHSESTVRLFNALGFLDMYHSWWFNLFLLLLTINLVACSIKRLPAAWRLMHPSNPVLEESLEKALSLKMEIRTNANPAKLKEKIAACLKAEFASPVIADSDNSHHLFAQKTPFARLGAYVVHLSIIVIFVGAIIGSLFGYKAFVNIGEGESAATVHTSSGTPVNLGFAVRCDDFSVSFYDTGAPREFKSLLTVLENGKPVSGYEKVPVIVNDPLTYKGITFYQSSYGQAGTNGPYSFTVRERKGGAPVILAVRRGESAKLPDGGSMHVMEATEEVSQFIPNMSGPAARIEVHPPAGSAKVFIVFRNHPDLDDQRGDNLIFSYNGADTRMFTGLQVAKDPGVWVVWVGCLLMVAGCYVAFFMSHRRIWVRIAPGRIVVCGNASKNQAGFEPYFEKITERLKHAVATEGN